MKRKIEAQMAEFTDRGTIARKKSKENWTE